RVGIAGELWADGGWTGLIGGLLALGLLAGLVARVDPATPLGLLRKAVAATLLLFALVTPIGALLPLALMIALPLWLLSGVTIARGARAADVALVHAATALQSSAAEDRGRLAGDARGGHASCVED